MAANIPGATNVLPGVFTDVITQSRGVSIPVGSRLVAMIGEGSTDETLVSQAVGGGADGLNSTYSSTSGADGRHFQVSAAPLVSNRTTLFKNGVPLVGLESLIDNNSFPSKYDYRIDISTGRIELQKAHLVDQGGLDYSVLSTNVGAGSISTLSLEDLNAPPETWSIRCVSVQRNNSNQPISGTAKFLAFGSVSGAKLDANGNPIVWVANGGVVSNGILKFKIVESSPAFREGDAFVIKVASGVLVKNDSLTANYIPSSYLNDPVLNQGLNDVTKRHGFPSLTNNLSLGAQLAFANNAPALISVQAAPPMPRRKSYVLVDSFNATSTNDDDFKFPLPPGVVPDFNSNIHFFVTDPATNVETQILPNKFTYYLLDTSGYPTTSYFINDTSPYPGYSYSYTVDKYTATVDSGFDGYIARNNGFTNQGIFTGSIKYDKTYVGKQLKLIDTENVANAGLYNISSVVEGNLYVTYVGGAPSYTGGFPDFVAVVSPNTAFEVIDPLTGLAVASGTDGTITPQIGFATATLTSASVDFTLYAGNKIKINGSTPSGNNGLYDMSNTTSTTCKLTKTVVNEVNMRYEILDPLDESYYVVVNRHVVPDGKELRVTLVDTKEASFYDAGWINALESLETVECDMVVPLPKQTISVVFQNSLSHCKAMSNIRNKKERVLLIGAISGLKPENLTGAKPAAVEDIGILEGIQGDSVTEVLSGNIEDLANYSVPDAFGNTYRCIYFYPDQIVVQAGSDNVLVDGFYIAAAAAGYLAADVRLENPLTNKVLAGFTILRNKQFSQQTLESLATAGVCTLQPVAGGGRVIWGITTSQSGAVEEQEISIVFIRDRVAKTLRSGFQGFIGTAETVNTGAILNTRAVILLNSLVSQGLITAYKDLVVQKDDVNPTQWNISVRCQPPYPVNYIYIKVNLGQL
jgi:hypothetical protein